jgi:TPP-dependent pyruvate/acetoin dehydrogenase alpha subunit
MMTLRFGTDTGCFSGRTQSFGIGEANEEPLSSSRPVGNGGEEAAGFV